MRCLNTVTTRPLLLFSGKGADLHTVVSHVICNSYIDITFPTLLVLERALGELLCLLTTSKLSSCMRSLSNHHHLQLRRPALFDMLIPFVSSFRCMVLGCRQTNSISWRLSIFPYTHNLYRLKITIAPRQIVCAVPGILEIISRMQIRSGHQETFQQEFSEQPFFGPYDEVYWQTFCPELPFEQRGCIGFLFIQTELVDWWHVKWRPNSDVT